MLSFFGWLVVSQPNKGHSKTRSWRNFYGTQNAQENIMFEMVPMLPAPLTNFHLFESRSDNAEENIFLRLLKTSRFESRVHNVSQQMERAPLKPSYRISKILEAQKSTQVDLKRVGAEPSQSFRRQWQHKLLKQYRRKPMSLIWISFIPYLSLKIVNVASR